MAPSKEQTRSGSKPRTRQVPWRWILGAALVLIASFALRWLPVREWIEASRGWIEARGPAGPIAFLLIYVLAGLLLVPGAALTMAAGALFGLGFGMALVPLATTGVASAAFLIARYAARERVEHALSRHPRLQAANRAISRGGWKIVLLLRLSPLVPFGLANYSFGLTRIAFWPYLGASVVGMLPGTFLYVYLGHLGAEGASRSHRSAGEWAMLAAGLLATAVAVIWTARIARTTLERRSAIGRTG